MVQFEGLLRDLTLPFKVNKQNPHNRLEILEYLCLYFTAVEHNTFSVGDIARLFEP
jgi:hypothetical protein